MSSRKFVKFNFQRRRNPSPSIIKIDWPSRYFINSTVSVIWLNCRLLACMHELMWFLKRLPFYNYYWIKSGTRNIFENNYNINLINFIYWWAQMMIIKLKTETQAAPAGVSVVLTFQLKRQSIDLLLCILLCSFSDCFRTFYVWH